MWVWSVALDEEHRGRGLGRAAMLLAEDEARRRGATEIGLNVFGFNDVALGLYRSLGYESVSVQMRKVVA
jgi:ribosomal protein S18 acetylase RimI-like enzyme